MEFDPSLSNRDEKKFLVLPCNFCQKIVILLRTLLGPSMMQMTRANDSLMISSLSRCLSALPLLLRNFGLSNQLIKNLFSREVYYCSIVPLVNVKELDLTFISPFSTLAALCKIILSNHQILKKIWCFISQFDDIGSFDLNSRNTRANYWLALLLSKS